MNHRDQHRDGQGKFKGRTGAKYFKPAHNPLDAWMSRYGGEKRSEQRGNDPAPETVQPNGGGQ